MYTPIQVFIRMRVYWRTTSAYFPWSSASFQGVYTHTHTHTHVHTHVYNCVYICAYTDVLLLTFEGDQWLLVDIHCERV